MLGVKLLFLDQVALAPEEKKRTDVRGRQMDD